MNKKFGLGKGLDALIQDYAASSSMQEIALEQIIESPYQPRMHISQDSLSELIQSIEENGIIEPLVVRKKLDTYELIAGHRRLNALKYLKKETAPVYILEVTDQKAAELTIVENIQRLDLNPVELARSIQQMIKRFQLTHELVAKTLGKSRVYITNMLRLLSLDEETLTALEYQKISEGHGRLLLQISVLPLRQQLLQKTLALQWSVKQLSDNIKHLQQNPGKERLTIEISSHEKRTLEKKWSLFFHTPVRIKGQKIEFLMKDTRDFASICNTFNTMMNTTK